MTTFFTADPHFFHKNILKYCKRPFADVHEMNETLIANWNSVVGSTDETWVLGDFAFASPSKVEKIVGQLNGRIHLVYGNHDEREVRALDCWASRQHYAEQRIDGHPVVLSHYAMRAWNGSHKGSYMLYGHTHNYLPPINRSLDVGVDAFDYTPVTFAQIRARLGDLGLDEVPVLPPSNDDGSWKKAE